MEDKKMSDPLSGDDTKAAIKKYSTFVDSILKPQLKYALQKRDVILNEYNEYIELQELVTELQKSQDIMTKKDQDENQSNSLNVLMDIGQKFHVRAKIPDPSMLIIDIGLNFHVEMTLEEAQNFLITHLEVIKQKLQTWQQKARQIAEHINIVLESIQQLAALPAIV